MQKIQKNHKPPHYLSDGEIYFITSSTYQKASLFNSEAKKNMLLNVFREKAIRFDVKTFAFVFMDSHYHILIKIKNGKDLPLFIKGINGKSALLLNKMDGVNDRAVWYNYWDSCVKEEKDFWMRFSYIHHNPVKHNYVKSMEEYDFSSFGAWVDKKGVDWMNDVLESHSVVDFTVGDE